MRLARVAIVCGLLGLLAPVARAGDAVRLLVELPPDVGAIGPGESVPVQVVGQDADGARVGFGNLRVVLTADKGKVSVVKEPYNFDYTAPAEVNGVLEVRLRAHLEGAETVRGSTALRVSIPGEYVQLHLRTPHTTLDFGAHAAIDVLGEKRTGERVPVVDRQVSVSVEGHGSVEFVRLSHFRYRAPPASEGLAPGRRVRVKATLVNHPEVKGSLDLIVGRAAPPRPAPPRETPPAPTPTPTPAPVPPVETPVEPPAKPPVETPSETPRPTPPPDDGEGSAVPAKRDVPAVAWPGGHLEIAVWRTKDVATEKWSPRKRKLPPAGTEFVAPGTFQKIRARILSPQVTRVTHEWWVGERTKENVRTDGPGEEGRVRVVRNKQDRLTAHLEVRVPDNERPLHLVLLLHTADGKVIRQPLVLRRGRDRDRDGAPDAPE